ncbi:hypothetical protein [Clostridium sp. KNHs214]|nr:hypothetical protein [Clostridium sp. KNHs214]
MEKKCFSNNYKLIKILFQKDDEDPESEEYTYSLVELPNCSL